MTWWPIVLGYLLLFLAMGAAWPAAEQPVNGWARQIEADAAELGRRPSLAKWTKSHNAEKPAPLSTDYQLDDARICATSFARESLFQRTATFYLPEIDQPEIRATALPAAADDHLVETCRLQAIWYQATSAMAAALLVERLSIAWGAPAGASSTPGLPGSAIWKNVSAWHRGSLNIWVAEGQGSRVLVYVKRDLPTAAPWFGSTPELTSQIAIAGAKIAGLDMALTQGMLMKQPRCDSALIPRLAAWLSPAKGLPPVRKAAALSIGDLYASRCVRCASSTHRELVQLGARFKAGCSQGDVEFSHNFRGEAESLDPHGPSGELAALLSLNDPCSLPGPVLWPDLVIAKGEQVLRNFSPDRWAWATHYRLGRAYAAKLSLAYPDGDPEGSAPILLSESVRRDLRAKAIVHLKASLRGNPDSRERAGAWQEAWRLLAGLAPSPPRFGCGCE